MLSCRLVLYCDICIVSLQYFFYLRHFKLDFFTLHYITLHSLVNVVAYLFRRRFRLGWTSLSEAAFWSGADDR